MATLADQTIAALRSGHEALAALVRDLTEDDLVRPSAASEWQVSQVLSHLGSEANQRLVEAYESLDATAREELRIDLGFLPEPIDVATAARFRLNEFALHRWDVEVSFDPGATVAPEAVTLLLDQVGAMLAWTGKPDALAGRQATLALRLREPDQSYGLRLGDRIELTEVPEQPDGEFTAPAEAWLRLAVGRLGPRYTPEAVRVTGPVSLDDLRRVFPGF
jgi:hypothetical protein